MTFQDWDEGDVHEQGLARDSAQFRHSKARILDGKRFQDLQVYWYWPKQLLSMAWRLYEEWGHGPVVRVLSKNGSRNIVVNDLAGFDSMMTHASDPQSAAELVELRERMRSWRFYDQLRSDRDAPSRNPQIGTRAVSLSNDGSNIAAAYQTIIEIGDDIELKAAIDDAFAGSSVSIAIHDGQFELLLHQKGLLRPLRAQELSDGTLRYLLLAIALFSPRPAPFIVLNEPETSLHPDLLLPLSRLICKASERAQIMVVTHSTVLVEALAGQPRTRNYQLEKELGETTVGLAANVNWAWPQR